MKKLIVIVAILLIAGVVGFSARSNFGRPAAPMEKAPDDMMQPAPAGMDDAKTETMTNAEQMTNAETMMNTGEAAPAFSLEDVNGETHSLADLKGTKVYIKFWASWCPICLASMEETDRLSAEAEGFKVVTIVSPGANGEKKKADFITWYQGLDTKNTLVLLDDGGDIARAYGVRGYPTSAYIGSDGVLIKTMAGYAGNDSIKQLFEGIF